jgi:gamma-glutamylcyclotransferase (GGCT)/AIG2-like uncharacterized protein YtfP
MRHTKVFVYGTLRPCDARWAESGEMEPPVQGTTKGALYDYGGYPYADFDGDGIITGDILTLNEDALAMVRRVELGAGYVEREVIVETPTGHTVCTTYDAGPRVKKDTLPRLRRVPDDDWYNIVRMPREERYAYRNQEAQGVFLG